jgi:hypothetical protein
MQERLGWSAPRPYRNRVRSGEPACPPPVWRVPACRANRSVRGGRLPRRPNDRSPFRYRRPGAETAAGRNGSQLRCATPARAGRHCAPPHPRSGGRRRGRAEPDPGLYPPHARETRDTSARPDLQQARPPFKQTASNRKQGEGCMLECCAAIAWSCDSALNLSGRRRLRPRQPVIGKCNTCKCLGCASRLARFFETGMS